MSEKIFELSDEFKALKDTKKMQEEELKKTNAEIAEVEISLIDLMVNEELSAFKRNGQGFSLVMQNYPQAEPEKKDVLYKELKARGYEDLFTINSKTLTKELKDMIENNDDEIPDWLVGLVRPFEKTSIRMYKE